MNPDRQPLNSPPPHIPTTAPPPKTVKGLSPALLLSPLSNQSNEASHDSQEESNLLAPQKFLNSFHTSLTPNLKTRLDAAVQLFSAGPKMTERSSMGRERLFFEEGEEDEWVTEGLDMDTRLMGVEEMKWGWGSLSENQKGIFRKMRADELTREAEGMKELEGENRSSVGEWRIERENALKAVLKQYQSLLVNNSESDKGQLNEIDFSKTHIPGIPKSANGNMTPPLLQVSSQNQEISQKDEEDEGYVEVEEERRAVAESERLKDWVDLFEGRGSR